EEREKELEIVPIDLRPVARDAALDLRVASPGRTITVIDTTAETTPARTRTAPIPTPPIPTAPAAAAPTGTATPAVRGPGPLGRLRRRPKPAPAAVPSIDFTEATDAPVRTPPIVLGEENKVRQVVTNLLGNARR